MFPLAEHGVSTHRWVQLGQRAVEPLTVRFLADHLARDPFTYLAQAGFTIAEAERGGRFGLAFRVQAAKGVNDRRPGERVT
jgi:hypothetical protein